jgi:RimJ/RimL family protein N-acetyltransferase
VVPAEGEDEAVDGPITLVTKRLLLREFVESDWPAVHQYATDPEVFRYRSAEPNSTEAQTRRQVRQIVLRSKERPRMELTPDIWHLACAGGYRYTVIVKKSMGVARKAFGVPPHATERRPVP